MYFIKAKESENKWWQYLITISVVAFGYLIVGAIPLGIVLALKISSGEGIDLEGFVETYDPAILGIDPNISLFLLLFPAIVGFFVLLIFMIKLHKKKLVDIASAEGRIRWNRMFIGMFIWLVLLIAAEGVFYYIDPENYEYSFNLSKFLPLLIVSLLILPIQTTFEELFFRSYLMAGSGLLFRMRFLALLITSIAFGMLHFSNPEVKEFGFWSTMPYYVGFGLFAGLLVIFDNGIEMACGVHAINNIYSAVLVTYESSVLKTPAVWKIKTIDPLMYNLGFVVLAIVFILIMSRIYKWGNWGKLFLKIGG
jgi:membrane protease YdiL (CAAX protease family)